MKYVLDTTAFSAAMRREEDLLKFFKSHRPGDMVTVPPAVAEMDRLLSIIRILPWTSESSYYFGVIKTNLEGRGELIDDFDIAIGAIAMAHKCCVLTANLDHFKRIKNLRSEFWN